MAQKQLPVQGHGAWVVVWQGRNTRYGPDGAMRSNCVLYIKKTGHRPKKVALYVHQTKGGRHWLRTKLGGKPFYWHRLVAWCFSNPLNLSWEVYHKQDKSGAYKWQAGHLSLDECDCTVGNLQVMTRLQNKAMYKGDASQKHGTVFKG